QTLAAARFRDPRYAPRRLEVEHRPGGEMVLTNPTPYSTQFPTLTAALNHWAMKAPARVWLAERSGDGWRTVTFGEAQERVQANARPGDPAKYLLTSGSTGHPKAVIGSHGNISLNSAQIAACFNDPEPPVMVNSAPWSHSLGANSILHMSLHRGGTLYID